jgi:hypothetical protein
MHIVFKFQSHGYVTSKLTLTIPNNLFHLSTWLWENEIGHNFVWSWCQWYDSIIISKFYRPQGASYLHILKQKWGAMVIKLLLVDRLRVGHALDKYEPVHIFLKYISISALISRVYQIQYQFRTMTSFVSHAVRFITVLANRYNKSLPPPLRRLFLIRNKIDQFMDFRM